MAKRALVLGGGGAKGSYQMGAWKAFRELGLEFDMIVGTSIGALNGALMVQDAYDTANGLWNSIEYENIFHGDRRTDIRSINGVLDMLKFAVSDGLRDKAVDAAPLEALIKSCIDEEKIRASKTDFGLVTVEAPSLRAFTPMINDIPRGMLWRYLMASSACFPVFSPYDIDGISYIDGGYFDNVPINMAIAHGADEITAVDLDGVGFTREPMAGIAADIVRIRSFWDLGTVFDFDKNVFIRNRRLGYYDTLKAFEHLDGFYYTFCKGEMQNNLQRLPNGITELQDSISRLVKRPMAVTVRAVEKDTAIDFLTRFNWKKNAPQMLCRVAELAGVVYSVSPERVYSFEKFNERLLCRYAELPSMFSGGEAVRENDLKHLLAAALQSVQSDRMSASITQLLMRGEDSGAANILAGLLPREYAAACYIKLLLKNI